MFSSQNQGINVLDKDRIWLLFPQKLLTPLNWATTTSIFTHHSFLQNIALGLAYFNVRTDRSPLEAPQFPTLIASVLWKGALPWPIYTGSRQSWEAAVTYLSKRETFLVINCFWRLCQICEQCLIWTLMLIGPAFPAFFWQRFSATSAVSGYLFRWAFFNLEWIGFSSSEKREKKKKKQHFKSNKKKKKSSWKKKQPLCGKSLKIHLWKHRDALLWKRQLCEMLGSPAGHRVPSDLRIVLVI